MKQTTKTKTKYRALQWTLFGSEFISILTPFIVIGAVKFDEFFVNNPEGWKITLGGTICLAVCGLCVLLTTRAKEKELQMNPLVSLMIVFGIIALLSFLFANILEQIAMYCFFAMLGIAGALGLDIGSKQMKAKADMYIEAKKKLNADNIYEEMKKEQATNKKIRM